MAQAHTEFALSHDVGGEDEETVAAAASGDAAAGGMSSKVCQAGGAARRRTHVKQGVSSWRSCASAARAFAHSRQLWMRVCVRVCERAKLVMFLMFDSIIRRR